MNLLYFLAFIWDRVRVSETLGRDLLGDYNKRGMRMMMMVMVEIMEEGRRDQIQHFQQVILL